MKRAFIFHGWDGVPEHGWYLWLKKELEKNGFQAFAPELPNTENPRINEWIPAIAAAVGTPDQDTYLVGHSLSCQAIVRYLETLPEGVKIGGALFIAGYFRLLTGLTDDELETAKRWIDSPVDFSKAKSHLPRSFALFSDNDPFVPLDNQDDFREKLGSEILVQEGKGHFMEDDGCMELPIALEKLLQIAK